jgi:hypothetical protein
VIYFIFSFIIIIFLVILFANRKIKQIKIKVVVEKKNSDDYIMRDLQELRKLLKKVEDPETKLEIIKKIEIITSMYN